MGQLNSGDFAHFLIGDNSWLVRLVRMYPTPLMVSSRVRLSRLEWPTVSTLLRLVVMPCTHLQRSRALYGTAKVAVTSAAARCADNAFPVRLLIMPLLPVSSWRVSSPSTRTWRAESHRPTSSYRALCSAPAPVPGQWPVLKGTVPSSGRPLSDLQLSATPVSTPAESPSTMLPPSGRLNSNLSLELS